MPFTYADTIHVAVASNFTAAFEQLKTQFESESEHKLITSYGSTGKLYAQIVHGAPFQIFLAADTQSIEKLIEQKRVRPANHFVYAEGQLALWGRLIPAGTEENNTNLIRPLLTGTSLKKLALANPKTAPYGFAAQSVLQHLELLPELNHKLVYGENITQTLQFVSTGNAQLGFVALSQLIAKPTEQSPYIAVPIEFYPPIRQAAALLDSAQDYAAAVSFWRFLQSDQAQQIILENGYTVATSS
ncbi:molybdate ABC transporter substrate-binding protein [Spongiibacter sp. KMU-158]|uniref:Molybdate ABC transporter substrate-binding protein n=1 Tax=Spongiibacter pelagi TaxID=2760804 RepID=A0A927C343_9GAMM|nr:molybdate ABC transporter substrate-binding protein [Spongiibacter pelagi]MBD2859268.1 molybdate ABC transporter substrate-binding protein [Spongiibacter pelagi]